MSAGHSAQPLVEASVGEKDQQVNEGMWCPPDHPWQCRLENCEPAGPRAPLLGITPCRVSRPEAGLLPPVQVWPRCVVPGSKSHQCGAWGATGDGVQALKVGDRRQRGAVRWEGDASQRPGSGAGGASAGVGGENAGAARRSDRRGAPRSACPALPCLHQPPGQAWHHLQQQPPSPHSSAGRQDEAWVGSDSPPISPLCRRPRGVGCSCSPFPSPRPPMAEVCLPFPRQLVAGRIAGTIAGPAGPEGRWGRYTWGRGATEAASSNPRGALRRDPGPGLPCRGGERVG